MRRQLLIFLLILGITPPSISQNTIYHFKVDSVTGNSKIDFGRFQGKKILIVNIATRSSDTSQLQELRQLQAQQSNLVVVVFPSNSFNNESYDNEQIARFFKLVVRANFLVAAKVEVTGTNMENIYKWLTKKQNNGLSDSRVRDDFQKYLINEQGKLIGSYGRRVPPMSQVIINAINLPLSN
jgi:glutathione peroxidase